ncbi:MAG: DUF1786 domain-containing protein [Thermomicrobiales bacterium]|nr:DUF1786 domain-containing protein [Thermomicrobiales bacterium]
MTTKLPPTPLLAIDVGAGTQDILLYDPTREPENCLKLVLPSQTQVVGARVRAATAARQPLHLQGVVMGGGASSDAMKAHLAAGLPLSATPAAARTIHNDLERVTALGVTLRDDAPEGSAIVQTGDVDLAALRGALAPFGVSLPERLAVAVQDHGYQPGAGNNDVRFAYLQGLLEGGGDLRRMIYTTPPSGMTRLAAVTQTHPGALLMDTGAAAVLGALADPAVGQAAATTGAILVNVGNMHTFATLVKGERLYGLFEHHTGGITAAIIGDLVEGLRRGTLDTSGFRDHFDGHGAALDPAYRQAGPFPFVAITGPNRRLARALGYHEAAPHGDMMLAGSWGLVAGAALVEQDGR